MHGWYKSIKSMKLCPLAFRIFSFSSNFWTEVRFCYFWIGVTIQISLQWIMLSAMSFTQFMDFAAFDATVLLTGDRKFFLKFFVLVILLVPIHSIHLSRFWVQTFCIASGFVCRRSFSGGIEIAGFYNRIHPSLCSFELCCSFIASDF